MRNKYALYALALGLLTACDPIKDEADLTYTTMTPEELLADATFSEPVNNTITFSFPSATSVTVYVLRPDGTENVLASGKNAGSFSYTPTRGSDPTQTIYFRYVAADGQVVTATQQFTFVVAADLTPDMKLLVSNEGRKVWTWNTEAPDGQVWGNMGTDGAQSGRDFALSGANKWWGVTSEEEFMGQLNHTDDGQAHGDESMSATMVMSEDGSIACYDASGSQIRSGKFQVLNYDPSYSSSPAHCGILQTDAGSILFPYEINSGGRMPTNFEIAYLSSGRLVLVYPDNGEWSGWSEGTFWQFKSESDIMGCLTDNSSATWTWDTSLGAFWGNAGYAGANGASFGNTGESQWWGVTSEEEFMGQLQHTPDGQAHGDESLNATMVFTSDGIITKYDGSGAEMTNGVFSVESYDGVRTVHSDSGNAWELGKLTTTAGTILWPYAINTGGFEPTEFEILKISDTQLVLVYAADGTGAWGECTYWRFKKVTE